MAERRWPSEDARARSAARPNWAPLALLLLALIAAAPIWTGPGLVNTRSGGDSPFLFIRLHQLVENLRAGVLPARWMPDAAYGLGYPFFNFYAALPYYFAAIFNLLGFDLLVSIKIVQSLGFVFAAWAMVGWTLQRFRSVSGPASVPSAPLQGSARDASYTDAPCTRMAAWLAAAAYTYAPFHLVNVYVRGDSLSEFYAFIFYPLILWSIDAVTDRPRPRSIALLALAYSGLILTHNVSALIFSPFLLLYVLIRSWRLEVGGWRADLGPGIIRHPSLALRHSAFNILHCALGIVLGLLVSAWYWLPALGEAHLVQLDVQTTGYFNYSGHFRSADLIQSSPGFDYDTEPPHTPFAMGLAQAVAALAGAVTLILTWRRGSIGFRVFTLTGLIISTAMITPLSKPVWDSLPLLPLAQFPWRFLSVQALFTSLAIGHLAIVLRGEAGGSYSVLRSPCADTQYAIRNTKLATWLTVVLGIMLAASALLPLRPDYLSIRADEITPERIQLYEAFTTNVGTTIRAEYLPRTTIPRPYTGPALIDPAAPPRAIPIRGEVDAEQTARGPISQSWTVRAESDSTLAFPTLYFPGWQASIDGLPVETRATADLGTIEIDVPVGEHAVALSLGRTPLRAGAEIVSLVAVLGLLGMLAFNAVRRRPALRSPRPKGVGSVAEGSLTEPHVLRITYYVSSGRYEIALLALAGILAVLATSANTVEARDDNLVMDFESKPWLHHGAADFGAARLARYEYAERFAAGAPFTVTLEWADVAATDAIATVQLVAPSLHAFGALEPLASISAPIREGVHVYVLDVPGSLPRGTYYLRVDVANASGMEGATFLRPIMYGDFAAASDTLGWARIGDAIELKAVYLEHNEPNRLTVAFDWVALKPIAANYAVSLRLQDATGRAWVVFDTQPGYGFQPTSAWLPGENQHDRYTLTLPADMPREANYALDVVWYRVASQQEIGRVRVPDVEIGSLYGETEVLPPPRTFDVPPMQQRVDATFGDAIRLLGYDMAQAGNRLTLTLHWQAIADIGADYKFFVHVFDPVTEEIVAQVDAMPGGNAYPTSRWVQGEVVSERVELELESGTYRVATGWYDPVSEDRLMALDAEGHPLPANRVILGEGIRVP